MFTAKVFTDHDGAKILRLIFQLKDEKLFNATQRLLQVIEPSKLDINFEFSERPARHQQSETLQFRVNVDTECKRTLNPVIQAALKASPLLRGANPESGKMLAFMCGMSDMNLRLEFDNIQDFWMAAVDTGVPEGFKKPGWHSLAWSMKEEFMRTLMGSNASAVPEPVLDIYKKAECLQGIASLHLICGQHAIEAKGENLDLFLLVPTWSELERTRSEQQQPTEIPMESYQML